MVLLGVLRMYLGAPVAGSVPLPALQPQAGARGAERGARDAADRAGVHAAGRQLRRPAHGGCAARRLPAVPGPERVPVCLSKGSCRSLESSCRACRAQGANAVGALHQCSQRESGAGARAQSAFAQTWSDVFVWSPGSREYCTHPSIAWPRRQRGGRLPVDARLCDRNDGALPAAEDHPQAIRVPDRAGGARARRRAACLPPPARVAAGLGTGLSARAGRHWHAGSCRLLGQVEARGRARCAGGDALVRGAPRGILRA